MTHIIGIRLTNWKRYRGEFVLDLRDDVYAIAAEREGDARRSNYQGKSSFAWAIRFALTGKHDAPREDDFITWGEQEGGVDLELDNGVFVSRVRRRGGPTKLLVVTVEWGFDAAERELLDDEAQRYIDRQVVGMSPDEQEATWWSGQKCTDYFTTADPATLTELVTEWTGLAKVREAHGLAANALKTLVSLHNGDVANLQAEQRVLNDSEPRDVLEQKLRAAEENQRATESLIAADADAAVARAQRAALQRDFDEHARLVEYAERLTRELPPTVEASVVEAAAKAAGIAATKAATRSTVRLEKQKLARGGFDGKCPVNGCACPIRDDINLNSTFNAQQYEQALRRFNEADAERAKAEQEARRLSDAWVARERAVDVLERTRARIRDLQPAVRQYGELVTPTSTGLDLQRTLEEDKRHVQACQRNLAAYAVAEKRRDEAQARIDKTAPEIRAHREVVQFLGPAGLQRRLARVALDQMEDRAAESLERCGVDVELAFEWERDTQQPADACDACGAAFPVSRKVKACGDCGAARGLKKEQKLRTVVTPKSGGADDLASLMARLAVAAWLKERRQSSWGVLVLDEPLGEFDEYNRKAVVQQLRRLAADAGFTQVFLIAHSRDALDAMPARIRIVGGEGGSKISVDDGGPT